MKKRKTKLISAEAFKEPRDNTFKALGSEGKLFETVMDAIGDLVSIQNLDMEIVYQNKALKEVMGDHGGEYCYKIYERRDCICEGCPMQQSFQTEQIVKALRTGITKEGVARKYELITAPLKDKQGKTVAGIEVVRDATKKEQDLQEMDRIAKMLVRRDLALTEMREKREEEFQELEKRSKELEQTRGALTNILEDVEGERKKAEEERDKTLAVINNFADALLILELNTVTLFNPKAEEFFYLDKKEVVGKKINELQEHKRLKDLFDLLNKKKVNFSREELAMGDGFIMEISAICINRLGKCDAKMIILHDITREKSVERLKTEFVSIAAHQLRTPLSAIKWILRMFLDGDMGQVSETQSQFLQKTYDSNERMINLVNDLLNVTRIEEGKFLEKMQQQDISALLNEVAEPFREKIKEKGLNFNLVLPDKELPKLDVDKEKIILAIQNLLENAMNYTKTGGIILAGEYSAVQKEFLIKIQDTGIGIPKEQHERVFSRFFRSANALKTETEGTGLGLFIAKNIIEAHGGKVWFESKENEGSTFFFTLPLTIKNGVTKL